MKGESRAKAKQLSVWVEDRPGMLGKVASALGAKKVNIIGFMAPAADGRDAIRMVVDKPAAVKKALAAGGWETSEEDQQTALDLKTVPARVRSVSLSSAGAVYQ